MIICGMKTKDLRDWCKTMPEPYNAQILFMENDVTKEEQEEDRMVRIVFCYGASPCCPHRLLKVLGRLMTGRPDVWVILGGLYRFHSIADVMRWKLSQAFTGRWSACEHNLMKGVALDKDEAEVSTAVIAVG